MGLEVQIPTKKGAAANAVRHTASAHGGFTITVLDLGDTLRVEVADEGGRDDIGPRVVRAPDAAHGRGLLLVDTIADRWGTWGGAASRTTWFEVGRAAVVR